MHHNHTNGLPVGFSGAGALMDPGFLRQATNPHADSAEPSPVLEWAAGLARRATAFVLQTLHRTR